MSEVYAAMNSQNETVLKHLQSGRSITPGEALSLYGIMRLGGRVYELKKQGHVIHSEFVTVKTRNGTARVKRYWMDALADAYWIKSHGRTFVLSGGKLTQVSQTASAYRAAYEKASRGE